MATNHRRHRHGQMQQQRRVTSDEERNLLSELDLDYRQLWSSDLIRDLSKKMAK